MNNDDIIVIINRMSLNKIIIANCNNDLSTIEGCYFSLTNNPIIDYFIVNKQIFVKLDLMVDIHQCYY